MWHFFYLFSQSFVSYNFWTLKFYTFFDVLTSFTSFTHVYYFLYVIILLSLLSTYTVNTFQPPKLLNLQDKINRSHMLLLSKFQRFVLSMLVKFRWRWTAITFLKKTGPVELITQKLGFCMISTGWNSNRLPNRLNRYGTGALWSWRGNNVFISLAIHAASYAT